MKKVSETELKLLEATRVLLRTIRDHQKELADAQTKMASYLDDAIHMIEKLEQGPLH